MEINIDELAERQLNDFRFVNPGTAFVDQDFHIDVKTAYTVQDAVARLRVNEGEKVIGYKVGCTGPGTTKLFGMNGPIRGTLFEDEIHTNGTLLEYRSFYNLAVEAEMAFEIGENNQIISVFPIIELHNFVFRGPKKTLSELIANNGLNKGFILSEKRWRRAPEFYSEESVISLEVNGSIIDSGKLWPMPGGPSWSLTWLVRHLTEYDLKLSKGDIVLGGTALGLFRVKPGDKITVNIDRQQTIHCAVNFD